MNALDEMSISTADQIKILGRKYFDEVAFTSATRPSTMDYYEKWIAEGQHGSMSYLARHQERKSNPQLLLHNAKSWISFILNYDTQEPLSIDLKDEFKKDKKGWIARYARGTDYHFEIEARHQKLISELKMMYPTHGFLSCVDTKAVLERDVAQRSGLGWIGKNTCLINQEFGSFVFLSEILTTLSLPQDKPVMDHCGTCTKCLDACPTKALVAPHKLDAKKCISYWTIEVNEEPPKELSKNFGTNFFGCDICQDVCPWNQKSRRTQQLSPQKESGLIDLRSLLKTTDSDLKKDVQNTSLNRAKPPHLKRNAFTVLENLEG
ncbi:MAG: tRNA epoxyqueuosine(34) reductase QueG [Oligoflexia bacterium]|nr:tRNA epoxyqueuosine(34) reductase QueG [Oligoflexia bacterium]